MTNVLTCGLCKTTGRDHPAEPWLKAQAGLPAVQYSKASQAGDGGSALPGLPGGGASSLFNILV